MQPFASKATAPNDDRRWKLVDATMRKHGNEPSALIESLHTVQESFGYLDDIALCGAVFAGPLQQGLRSFDFLALVLSGPLDLP